MRSHRGERRGAGAKHIDVFGALADPTRRRIIELLSRADRPVHELVDDFSVSRPAISQHLSILRSAGLVTERRVGRERHYRLRVTALRKVTLWVARYERFWENRLERLARHLHEMSDE